MKTETWKRLFISLLCLALLIAALPALALPLKAASVEYYGRKQLESMPNATALTYAYDQIVAGVEATEASISIYNGKDPISSQELSMVMDVYRRDYAHHFWLGSSYSYVTANATCTRIKPKYLMTGAVLEQAKKDFEAAADKILAGITGSMSELEREIYLHDTLAGMITYNSSTHAHNAYGALVEGIAVCEGYTEALQYQLQRAGICSFIALGYGINASTGSMEKHSWNYVRIDGEFYHVDLTWDDQGSRLYHAYLNQTDDVMENDHSVDPTDYPLPVCNSTKAMYFTGKETLLTSYDAEHIGQILKEQGLSANFYISGSVQEFITWYKDNIRAIARTAGVSGAFKYGHATLGQEVCLSLIVSGCSHSNMEHHSGTKPTCTADGHKDYYRCSCGKYFEDENATVPIPDLATWKKGAGKISKTAHNYVDGWDFDSTGHWHGCTCGAKTDSIPHQDGDKDGYCDACGYQTGTPPKDPIVPPPEDDDPKETEPKEDDDPVVPPPEDDDPKETEPPEGDDPEVTNPTEGDDPEVTDPTEGDEPEVTDPTEGDDPGVTDPTEGDDPGVTDPTEDDDPGVTDPTEEDDPEVTEPTKGEDPAATDPTQGGAPAEEDHTKTIVLIAIPTAILVVAAVVIIIKKKR